MRPLAPGGDLPGNAPPVLAPAALAFCAAAANDGLPEAVGLGLVVGDDLERKRLIVLDRRTAVEAYTRQSITVNSTMSTSPCLPAG